VIGTAAPARRIRGQERFAAADGRLWAEYGLEPRERVI
jgi:hypothetical protein